MLAITQRPSFKLIHTVLSFNKPFTLSDILTSLKAQGVEGDKDFVEGSLTRLRENGIIIENGSYYSVHKRSF